jgi:hypothetical protein
MRGNQKVMQKTFVSKLPQDLDKEVNEFRMNVFVVASTTSAVHLGNGEVLFYATIYYEM